MPDTLLESEMFGYERGAFTGAQRNMRGKFEQAHTGILFLDEIGDMSLGLQSKLLHALQDGAYTPLKTPFSVYLAKPSPPTSADCYNYLIFFLFRY
jgi:transcriptional regulator with GAF, ATPase, and Fis domain